MVGLFACPYKQDFGRYCQQSLQSDHLAGSVLYTLAWEQFSWDTILSSTSTLYHPIQKCICL